MALKNKIFSNQVWPVEPLKRYLSMRQDEVIFVLCALCSVLWYGVVLCVNLCAAGLLGFVLSIFLRLVGTLGAQ